VFNYLVQKTETNLEHLANIDVPANSTPEFHHLCDCVLGSSDEKRNILCLRVNFHDTAFAVYEFGPGTHHWTLNGAGHSPAVEL